MRSYFRRSKEIVPGLRFTVSKGGLGFSVGPRSGPHITVSPKGKITSTIPLPGSGFGVQETFSPRKDKLATTHNDLKEHQESGTNLDQVKILEAKITTLQAALKVMANFVIFQFAVGVAFLTWLAIR